MLTATRHGDVTQLEFSTRTSRALGMRASAYVVDGVLVDCGFPAVGRDLARWLDAHPVRGAILTHHHEDHAGNVELLAARGVPLAMPGETLPRVRAPKPIALYRRACWGSAPPLRSAVRPFAHPGLALLPARGHSPDHHVVWDPGRRLLFGGDLFIAVKVRVAHPGEDIRAQRDALRTAIALGPLALFDAHRGPLDDPIGLLSAKADWLDEMIGRIEALHARGWGARAITRRVLGPEPPLSWASGREYAHINFVRGVLATAAPPARPGI
jgi:glyoxylase-like metal-dependent hydrolase (beta-lactamase superfamily II)